MEIVGCFLFVVIYSRDVFCLISWALLRTGRGARLKTGPKQEEA